jgi:asparaginyl-tRNA synthetase
VPQGYEIDVESGRSAARTSSDYPITPKEHGVEFLMDNRHLWLRSSQQWAIMRVRTTIKRAIIDFLDNNGFLNIDTPIITPSGGRRHQHPVRARLLRREGVSGPDRPAVQRGQHHGLWQGVLLRPHLPRREESKTRRHLAEFWMVEPEMAYFDLEHLMGFEERVCQLHVQTHFGQAAPNWPCWSAT